MAETTMSPNESASHITAGTNASPINSFISNISAASHHFQSLNTILAVKSGEKIAYIQSLIARVKRINIRAIVRTQNTKNIIVENTTLFTSFAAFFITSTPDDPFGISCTS